MKTSVTLTTSEVILSNSSCSRVFDFFVREDLSKLYYPIDDYDQSHNIFTALVLTLHDKNFTCIFPEHPTFNQFLIDVDFDVFTSDYETTISWLLLINPQIEFLNFKNKWSRILIDKNELETFSNNVIDSLFEKIEQISDFLYTEMFVPENKIDDFVRTVYKFNGINSLKTIIESNKRADDEIIKAAYQHVVNTRS